MPTRREFLMQSGRSVAAAGVAIASRGAVGAEGDAVKRLPLVDTHQHLWDLTKLKLPWLENAKPLARSFVMNDYRQATTGLNVVKTVYMEVHVHPSQLDKEAGLVLDLCRRDDNPMVAAVIGGRPAEGDAFARYLARYRDNRYVKGVRQVLHTSETPAGFCLQESFVRSVQLLGEMGLRFDICIRPGELGDAAKLIDACPGTRFVLDHCGNIHSTTKDRTAWRRDIERVAKRKHVICKISGQVDKAAEDWQPEDLAPIIGHCLDAFGPERVVFGGDWPVCTLGATFRGWVAALMTIIRDRPEDQQRQLLHDNAVRFYEIG